MAFIPNECTLQEYENQIYSGQNNHRLYLKQGNTIIGEEQDDYASPFCSSFLFKNYIIDEGSNSFKLDNFFSKNIELALNGVQFDNLEDEIEVRIDTYIEEKQVWAKVPIGIFYIQENPTNDKERTNYVLRDGACKFDFNYNGQELIENSTHIDEQGNKYVTKLEILLDICSKANIEYNGSRTFIGYDDRVGIYDNTIKARTYISYLAEQSGCFATMDRYGKLIFVEVNNNNLVTREISEDYFERFENGTDYKISKVVYELASDRFEVGDDLNDTLFINSANPYITKESDVQRIANLVNGFHINSFSTGKVLGNPTIDSYDLIQLNYEGNTYETLGQYDLTFNGVFTSVYDTQISTTERETNVSTDSNEVFKKVVKTEIDNVNGTLKLFVQKDDIINSINLSTEGIEIDGQKISLKGKDIDLTSDSITITSTNFKVDENGNLECNNAKINGGTIDVYDDGSSENATIKLSSREDFIIQIQVGDNISDKILYFPINENTTLFTDAGDKFQLLYCDENFYIDTQRTYSEETQIWNEIVYIYQNRNRRIPICEKQYIFNENFEMEIVSFELYRKYYQLGSNIANVQYYNCPLEDFIFVTDPVDRTTTYSSNGIEADIFPNYLYTQYDVDYLRNLIETSTWEQWQIEKYDLNGDGILDVKDLLIVSKLVNEGVTPNTPAHLSINTQSLRKNIVLTNGRNEEIFSLGLNGLFLNEKFVDIDYWNEYTYDTGWVTLTPKTGTSGTGYYVPKYRRIGKLVKMTGDVTSIKSNATIFTLPEDCRPSMRLTFAGTNDQLHTNEIRITEAGNVSLLRTTGTLTSGVNVFFDNVSFYVD